MTREQSCLEAPVRSRPPALRRRAAIRKEKIMTYAITLIASLLIAFTPGLPAQNPRPLNTSDPTGQWIFEAKLSAGTQTSQPPKKQSTVDPTQIEKNPVPPTVSFSASGRVTTADGRGVPGVKITFTLVSGKGQTPG